MTSSRMFGVYVHIPFCAARCDYCAFATWTDRDHLISDYVEACRLEIGRADLPAATSVFFGGGTPSLIAPELLMSILQDIDTVPGAEVTVECNPETVTGPMMKSYRSAGVNRISLGVQSMAPRVLALLGRMHRPRAVEEAVGHIRAAGIENFSFDIIYGASGETLAEWDSTLTQVGTLDPPHVSAYGLTVEPGTPLALDRSRYPDDDDQAEKYLLTDARLREQGLANYEISNWAKPGHESAHNRLYWKHGEYYGVGCSAHSHREGRRWWNVRTPERYINQIQAAATPVGGEEELNASERRLEALQLALRTSDGVPRTAFAPMHLKELGSFLEEDGDRVRLTTEGRLVANEIALKIR